MTTSVRLRPGTLADLPSVESIEKASFSGDQLSRRSLRHLFSRAHALNLVAEREGRVVGYISLLLRRGSDIARVYSLAVDPAARGERIGARLLAEAERMAGRAECARMRLEVRADNGAAIHRYLEAGYVQFAMAPGYYEDGEAALKFEKPLMESGSH
ncbi:MAG: GNAT family N-acetyltransferase [Pseudomonadales bacterium]|jgi:ribosomal protein S18 acetylase RimI-like enzyme